jgi:multiple sugar transport system substrate-binding protein
MSRIGLSLRAVAALVMAVAGALPVVAAEQAERALAAIDQMIASGEIKRGTVLKVAFKPGNINALLGPELGLQREWEKRTGVVINARVIPQQPAQANLRGNPDIDLTVARTHEYPDLLAAGLVEDLGPLLKQFGFTIPNQPPTGYIRPAIQSKWGERVAAMPADGDVTIYYLRRDLLEDPEEKAAFRKAYGRELDVPRTWQEYADLAEFFHRPEKGFYGAAEERDLAGGWMYWLPRYLSQGDPYRTLFDERMRPLIDSPAGVAATENYVRIARYSAPGATDEGKDYSFALPLFVQGKAFSTANTIAGAKLLNAETSAVRGKFIAIPIPGTRVGNKLIRTNVPIYGNNLVVSSRSKQRKLAFLFTMWLTDPDNSLRTVGVKGGHTDPYRWHHLSDARILALYTRQAIDVFTAEWAITLPPGAGVPGDGEYLDALDRQLWAAAKGETSPAEAMRSTAAEWERITEKRGRDKQIAFLRTFRRGFSTSEPVPMPARTQ